MSARTPAWAASPGLLRLPYRQALLPDYALQALPHPGCRAILTWGAKPTGWAGRALARSTGLPVVTLEDGFLRSIGLGEAGTPSLSLLVDDQGVHYDATRPSRLETLIAEAPDWVNEVMLDRARALVARLVETGLSKTSMGQPLDRSILRPGRRVLVVDQTAGDASLASAPVDAFARMVAAVRVAEPTAQILVKRHPAVAAGLKPGCIAEADLSGVTLIDQDVRPADLLAEVEAVHTVSSGLGFEALWRGLPVHCHGTPFYAGWGLTQDAIPIPRRHEPRTLEQLVAAALIRFPRYVDPVRGEPCEVEQAVERLLAMRRRAGQLSGHWSGTGFAPAKQAAVRRLLNAPTASVTFNLLPPVAVALANGSPQGRLVWWAGKETEAIRNAAAQATCPTFRMEDGFIRSRGLGSNFVAALSAVLDDQGIYYDPAQPSRLETLIETGRPTAPERQRARHLIDRIVAGGISKYNQAGAAAPDWHREAKSRERILVVGQVENDRSILMGCDSPSTNAGLIAAVRQQHPDAFLIWRAHPDVVAGNRPGAVAPAVLDKVDAVADGLSITACLDACDSVATLTSLTGFEALLRGRKVRTWGRPFYAGWGLTEDALPTPRRQHRPDLEALAHAVLVAYPLYVTPGGLPCEVEDLLDLLEHIPVAREPQGLARWWTGMTASLDRRRPQAY